MRVPDDLSNQRCSIALLKSSSAHNDLLVLFLWTRNGGLWKNLCEMVRDQYYIVWRV